MESSTLSIFSDESAVAKPPFASVKLVSRSAVRALTSFSALLVVLLTARVYGACRDSISDPDIWWHLLNARSILTNWKLPSHDTYSSTALGAPVIDHEWLSELLYYFPFNRFGAQGLFLVFAVVLSALLVAVFCITLRQCRDPFVAGALSFVGGLLAMVGFSPRTQHFGWLCFVGILAILLRFRARQYAPLWLVPILFCLWINCHGSWLIGLTIFGIFVGAGLVRRDIGRLSAHPWDPVQLKQLMITGLASVVALLVNPLGYRLLLYPFDMMFRQTLNIANVQEWASVDFNGGRGKLVAMVLAAIFCMALVARKRWRIDDAILTGFVVYCGLSHMRFLLLAGIVLPPILASYMGRDRSSTVRPERRILNSVLILITISVCAWSFPSENKLNADLRNYFPTDAVDFLRTQPQRGQIFNLYQWGGYLEWSLPASQPLIDSRTDIFEYNGVLRDYLDITQLKRSQELLDKYKVRYVLYPSDAALSYFLSKSQRWQRVYHDERADIYSRR